MVITISASEGSFSAPTETHTFDGFLCDLDGTIMDSTDAIVKAWHKIGAELGVDPNVILATSHGRRTIDTIKQYDPSKANWEYICDMEGKIPQEFGRDGKAVPGARELLEQMTTTGAPWAIVTSGTRPLMTGWLHVLKIPEPPISVTAEEVSHGKPDPECYHLGRKRIGLDETAKFLVLEDAPAGVRAGKAAGCKVICLATTHSIDTVIAAGADWVIKDLNEVKVMKGKENGWMVEIQNAWVPDTRH